MGIGFRSLLDHNFVFPGRDTKRRTKSEGLAFGDFWRFAGIAPLNDVDAFGFSRCNFRDLLAFGILNLHGEFTQGMALFEVVHDLSCPGGVGPYELGLTTGAPKSIFVIHDGGPVFEKMQILGQYLVVDLAQWADVVNDDDSPAVGTHDQVVGFALDFNEMHGHGWHIVGEFVPVLAPIQGNVQTELGAQKEQIRIHKIFLDVANETFDLRRQNRSPGSTEVGGFVGVGLHVAAGMSVKYRVGRSFVKTTGFDVVTPGSSG